MGSRSFISFSSLLPDLAITRFYRRRESTKKWLCSGVLLGFETKGTIFRAKAQEAKESKNHWNVSRLQMIGIHQESEPDEVKIS